jgi:hypothetical protein
MSYNYDRKLTEDEIKLYLKMEQTYVSPLIEVIRQIDAGEITFTDDEIAEAKKSLAISAKELFGELPRS